MKSSTAQYASVGAFFLFGTALIYIALTSFSEVVSRDARGYEVRAYFDDLLQLRRGDDVRMSGVRIGTVLETDLDRGRAYAVLQILPRFEVPADSSATISMAGLLGGNYIAIRAGTDYDQMLVDGDEISTRASMDINTALEELGGVAGGIGRALEDIGGLFEDEEGRNLFDELQKLVADNRENITVTIGNLRSVTDQISSGEGTLGKLIFDSSGYDELIGVANRVGRAADEAEVLLSEVRLVVDQVRSGEGSLGQLLYDDAIARELGETVSNIREFSEMLNSPDSTVGRLLSDDQIYLEVQSVIRKANRTLDSLGDAAPVSAVGIAASALF